jgi:integrase
LPGPWVAGQVKLHAYAARWIGHRVGLRPRTIELYQWLLARHIGPHLGNVPVASITPDMVRGWRSKLISSGVSSSAAAKAYRLLRAVLATAAEDRIIPRNPCRIRGGGDEKAPERPVLTIAQVFALADQMKDRRYRALVLLATFASLRWGEAIALRRCDLDLAAGTVRIERQYVEVPPVTSSGRPSRGQAGGQSLSRRRSRPRSPNTWTLMSHPRKPRSSSPGR